MKLKKLTALFLACAMALSQGADGAYALAWIKLWVEMLTKYAG